MEGRSAQTAFAMELSSSSRALLAVPGLSFRAKALGLGVLAASLPFWVWFGATRWEVHTGLNRPRLYAAPRGGDL